AGEQPPVLRRAELVQVLAEQPHERRRNRHGAYLTVGPLLQAAPVVRLTGVGPCLPCRGAGLRQLDAPPSPVPEACSRSDEGPAPPPAAWPRSTGTRRTPAAAGHWPVRSHPRR